MNTTSVVAVATVTVIGGTWAEGKSLDPKIIVGGAFVAFSLAIMSEASPLLGERFAVLVLIAALFRYGIPITQKIGIIGNDKKKAKGKGSGHGKNG